jgi:hypothetical protein
MVDIHYFFSAVIFFCLLTFPLNAVLKDDYFDKKLLYNNSKLFQLTEYDKIKLRRMIRDEQIKQEEAFYADHSTLPYSIITDKRASQKKGFSFAEIGDNVRRDVY